MPSRRTGSRHAPRAWIARGTLAVLALALGLYAVTFTAAQVVARRNPLFAHQLAPGDTRIAAQLAAALTRGADREGADRLARAALLRDPAAAAAASTLGANAQARGDAVAARRYFTYAATLSRRDAPAQLWAIQDAANRGDVAAVLRHYDIVLRTSPSRRATLFAALDAATVDASVRRALVRTLASGPVWRDEFVDFAALEGKQPRATAALFLDLARARVPVSGLSSVALVDGLVKAGAADEAWRYYAVLRPGADRSRSRDPRFTFTGERSSLLDWIAASENGVSASILPAPNGGLVDFSVPVSLGGPVLQQTQLLPAGGYRLSAQLAGMEGATARPYWVLKCGDGRELGRVEVPASGRVAGGLRVPADCPIQTLALVARPSDTVPGLKGQVNAAQLEPTR